MSNLLDSFFSYERDLIYNCPNSLGIKMEEMVSSSTYFKEKIISKLFHLLVLIQFTLMKFLKKKGMEFIEIILLQPEKYGIMATHLRIYF